MLWRTLGRPLYFFPYKANLKGNIRTDLFIYLFNIIFNYAAIRKVTSDKLLGLTPPGVLMETYCSSFNIIFLNACATNSLLPSLRCCYKCLLLINILVKVPGLLLAQSAKMY